MEIILSIIAGLLFVVLIFAKHEEESHDNFVNSQTVKNIYKQYNDEYQQWQSEFDKEYQNKFSKIKKTVNVQSGRSSAKFSYVNKKGEKENVPCDKFPYRDFKKLALIDDKNIIYIVEKWLPVKPKMDEVCRNIRRGLPGEIKIKDEINANDILFFQELGDVSYTTENVGNFDATPALKGAVYFGGAGAAIGAAAATASALQTRTVEHDNRSILIKFKDGSEKNLDIIYKKAFIELIPQKEYTYILMNKES